MAHYSTIRTSSSCALVGLATSRRAFYTFWPIGSVGSIFLSASYCDNKKCFVIRVLVVLCDKPEWESAVRVWPLGGRVGRVTRFAGTAGGDNLPLERVLNRFWLARHSWICSGPMKFHCLLEKSLMRCESPIRRKTSACFSTKSFVFSNLIQNTSLRR